MNAKHLFLIGSLLLLSLSSCVSAKKFDELKSKLNDAETDRGELRRDLNDCQDEKTDLAEAKTRLKQSTQSQKSAIDSLSGKNKRLEKQLEQLQDSYDALEKNSSEAMAANSKQNRKLLKDLEEKQANLQEEQQRLNKLKSDLESRSKRVDELESLIKKKDEKMKNLKTEVKRALTDFEGKGLSVEQRHGKIYVSMENKLLFSSGSYAVNTQGRQAVKQLASILEQNPDIEVLIEGHTDDVPYNGKGVLKDNWDLSTKRATSIVHLLMKNTTVNPKRLTAAGRSKFAPIASNDTANGRSKNRRIEVILSPKIDQLNEVLNTVE